MNPSLLLIAILCTAQDPPQSDVLKTLPQVATVEAKPIDVPTHYLCKLCNGIKRNAIPRQIRQALRIGMWAFAEIRNSATVGIEIANRYNTGLE